MREVGGSLPSSCLHYYAWDTRNKKIFFSSILVDNFNNEIKSEFRYCCCCYISNFCCSSGYTIKTCVHCVNCESWKASQQRHALSTPNVCLLQVRKVQSLKLTQRDLLCVKLSVGLWNDCQVWEVKSYFFPLLFSNRVKVLIIHHLAISVSKSNCSDICHHLDANGPNSFARSARENVVFVQSSVSDCRTDLMS